MVIFAAEQEVDKQDSDGRAGDDHDTVAKEEEAEHVVDFAEPHVVHNEVELNENGTEGKDANQEHGGNGPEIGC